MALPLASWSPAQEPALRAVLAGLGSPRDGRGAHRGGAWLATLVSPEAAGMTLVGVCDGDPGRALGALTRTLRAELRADRRGTLPGMAHPVLRGGPALDAARAILGVDALEARCLERGPEGEGGASLATSLAAIRSARAGGRPEPVRPPGVLGDGSALPVRSGTDPAVPPETREAP